ncbi:MAG: CCA tRNA nucleotidyltransferase [Acutalibacteraceae bacterium]
MYIPLNDDVELILNKLSENGFDCYIVGGCVRDSLLGIAPHDWDITTNALPQQISRIFSSYRQFDAGIKHGTVSVVINNQVYEITTFRIDGSYTDNRRPDSVTFTADIKQDLLRRDFTVNALAYNPKTGIKDFCSGIEDIKYKALRCVGNPDERFNEDALRILRCLRFASVYGFSIEPETSRSIIRNKRLLLNISAERIKDELEKLLCGDNADFVLRRYKEVFAVIIPEIEVMFNFDQNTPHHNKTLWKHTVSSIKYIKPDPVLKMTMLLHDIGKPQTKTTDINGVSHFKGHPRLSAAMADVILHRLRFSNEFIYTVTTLINYHDYRFNGNKKMMKKVLSKIGEEMFEKLLQVQYADMMAQSMYKREEKLLNHNKTAAEFKNITEENCCLSLEDLNINGRDLLNLGIPRGKAIGSILRTLLDMVIDEEINNEKQELISKAEQLYEKFS